MGLFKPNVEKMKAKGDIKGLIKALGYKKDDAVRQAATEALVEIGALAVEPLITALEYYEARDAAIEALTGIGLPAVGHLIAAVRRWDSDLESQAFGYDAEDEAMKVDLAPKPDTKALELRKVPPGWMIFVKDRDYSPTAGGIGYFGPVIDEMEASALTATSCVLGRIGASAVEPLLSALKDDDWRVRVGAARALGRIGDSRAVEPLLGALKDDDWHIRVAAATALGRIGDSRAVEPLIGALKDPEVHMRQSAAMALGQLGDGCAIEPIKAALEDEDKPTGQIIGYIIALKKLGVSMPIRIWS
jgi:HEAT repeat protein